MAAPEWEALFNRSTGWTGADGIYSIPFSGDERPGSGTKTNTFWIFNDTFIGEVDSSGQRLPGSTLVNNTTAWQRGAKPVGASIQFLWRKNTAGAPLPLVTPNTSPQHWFWPNDGVFFKGRLFLYALRMRPGGSGAFAFEMDGISLLQSRAEDVTLLKSYQQSNTPLYVPANGNLGEIAFGMAVMPNTNEAGAPNPDGFLYVYGLRNDAFNKKLLVARVPMGSISDFSAYRFWNGTQWVGQVANAVPVSTRLSSEFSVSPLPDGRFLLVFQLDTLSNTVAVRYGTSPVGPWGEVIPIWTCSEATLTPNTLTYNAKGHPHLSEPGEMLISYNVNTTSFPEHFTHASIYHPRFIRLRLN
ncbi:MAG: DUF4185 domain-containing protein [Blastocatellia bacterium]|nr:DUF4185 domain-containing protein [Blastocatellia bacterium]